MLITYFTFKLDRPDRVLTQNHLTAENYSGSHFKNHLELLSIFNFQIQTLFPMT